MCVGVKLQDFTFQREREREREKKVREAEGKKEREKDDGVANLQPWGNTLCRVVFSTCFNTACAERLGRC